METGLHRPFTLAGPFCYLTQRKVLDETQNEDDAVVGTQRREHPPQRIALGHGSGCVFAMSRSSRFGDRLRTTKS